ncbi:MAG: Efem/EfeO family lipoprotein [Thermomicrobiales bacterium]|nr:MAG: Efem/EfeO family lipoprotein [Thermomicrobiales bacterium]
MRSAPLVMSRRTIARGLAGAAAGIIFSRRRLAAGPPAGEPDLNAIKAYVAEQVTALKQDTAKLVAATQSYYAAIADHGFDYAAAWQASGPQIAQLVRDARQQWLSAHTHYELSEGIVAGVPSLSYFDVLLDAGPSGEEDPEQALDWSLTLPDGRVFRKPGNLFHSLTEPALWGTIPDFTGLRVDLDGDGQTGLGDALPDANVVLASTQALDEGAGRLQAAVASWQPTLEDAFTALSTMIPTMNQYFEQWKQSVFVAGANAQETAFVGSSRLLDVVGIVRGLDVTYDAVSSVVAARQPDLHQQIDAAFTDLGQFVETLYAQENQGKRFTAEEADLLGAEAEDRATVLAGLVSQAIALLGLQL